MVYTVITLIKIIFFNSVNAVIKILHFSRAHYFLINLYWIFQLPFSPLIPLLPPAITTVLSMSMSPFSFFAQSLHPLTFPHPAVTLDSIFMLYIFFSLKIYSFYPTWPIEWASDDIALAGVAQWFECQSENQRVAHSIPSLGHVPGLQARSPVEGVQEATTHWCFSPFPSPSFHLSLKINK